jgi:hypothetical protein
MVRDEVFEGMLKVCEYFRQHAETDQLFLPEFRAASNINDIIRTHHRLHKKEVVRILKLVNDVDRGEHYDGTGWFDYKVRLKFFLKQNGFDEIIK